MGELKNEIHQEQLQQQPPPPNQNQQQQPLVLAQMLQLSPESVLNQFRHLKAFKGTDEYPLSSFIRSVDTTLLLCNNDQRLKDFGMQIIITDKIQGEAGRCIRQLGDDLDWSRIIAKLKQHFQPHRRYSELYNYSQAVKIIPIWMLVVAILPFNQATLVMEKIDTELGFAEINVDEVEIVSKFDIVLHIIHPHEILDTVLDLESNINSFNFKNKMLLIEQITSIKNKASTLLSHRSKRGLVNGVGKGLKWLFGTLDDDDKIAIEEQLKENKENNDNTIKAMNQQVKINENFNNSITILKNTLQSDRDKIKGELNKGRKVVEWEHYLEQQLRINMLRERVDQIQDNIVSARLGIIHPNILSNEVLNEYKFDIQKLSNIRSGLASYGNDTTVLAVKIPTGILKTNKTLIVPIANSKNKQIDEDLEYIVRINNKTFNFKNDVNLLELKLSTNCIIKKNCKFINSPDEEIIEIANDFLILNNIKNKQFNSTCDGKNLVLSGNYFINFVNCTVRLGNNQFSNNVFNFIERFIVPYSQNITIGEDAKLDFEKIQLDYERNIEEITALKLHKVVNYSIGVSSFLIVIIFIIVAICLIRNVDRV